MRPETTAPPVALAMNCINVFSGFTSFDEFLTLARDAGFDGFFTDEGFADDFDALKAARAKADRLGLFFETSHSTMRGAPSLWGADANAADSYLEVLRRNITNCAHLDIPTLVVHVTPPLDGTASFETGAQRLRAIVDLAETAHVRLAFENTSPSDFIFRTLDLFREPFVGFCYDSGHEAKQSPERHYLPELGDRLFCTHLHDTGAGGATHLIPFDGTIDFARVTRELHGTPYAGPLTLELDYKGPATTESKKAYLDRALASLVKLRSL